VSVNRSVVERLRPQYRVSPNYACGSEMWSLRRLLFVRQIGSSLPILEVCGFRFQQFSDSGDHIFQQISTKSHSAMPTLYSMVSQTRNRNRILEMCKFRIRFRLVHCGTITSVTRYGFRQILHADHKCDRFYVWCFGNHKPEEMCDSRGVRIRIFTALGSGRHIFQRISTKLRAELKLSNADFVLSGK